MAKADREQPPGRGIVLTKVAKLWAPVTEPQTPGRSGRGKLTTELQTLTMMSYHLVDPPRGGAPRRCSSPHTSAPRTLRRSGHNPTTHDLSKPPHQGVTRTSATPQLGTRAPQGVMQGWSTVDLHPNPSKTKQDAGDLASTSVTNPSSTATSTRSSSSATMDLPRSLGHD
nr:hypothetical protein Iba_chr07bCG5210 [Ipomoea batatas]